MEKFEKRAAFFVVKRIILLVTFTTGGIREFDLPSSSIYYQHNLLKTLKENKFLDIGGVLYASAFIRSIEDITETIQGK